MVICNLELILALHHSITCLSHLMGAILPNLHLVDMPLVGTSQLYHQTSKVLLQVVMITIINSLLHSSSKRLVVQQLQLIIVVTITVSHQLLATCNQDKVMLRMAMVDTMHLHNQVMDSQHHMNNKVMAQHKAMAVQRTLLKRVTLPPMVVKEMLVKHLLLPNLLRWVSKGTIQVRCLAQILAVIHLKEVLNLVTVRVAMGVNHQLSRAMDHHKGRNQWSITLPMGRHSSLLPPQEAMARQDINHSLHLLAMDKQNQVCNGLNHLLMVVLQLRSRDMVPHPMQHNITPLIAVIHSLQHILLTAMQVGALVGLMRQRQLLKPGSKVELEMHHRELD